VVSRRRIGGPAKASHNEAEREHDPLRGLEGTLRPVTRPRRHGRVGEIAVGIGELQGQGGGEGEASLPSSVSANPYSSGAGTKCETGGIVFRYVPIARAVVLGEGVQEVPRHSKRIEHPIEAAAVRSVRATMLDRLGAQPVSWSEVRLREMKSGWPCPDAHPTGEKYPCSR